MDNPTYPPGTIRALLDTDLVTDPTRAALQERLQPSEDTSLFLDEGERATLRAVCARLFPTTTGPSPDDLVADFDGRLLAGKTDGWRYDTLPPDEVTQREGLHGLDQSATDLFGAFFAALEGDQQDAVLRSVQEGTPPGEIWQTLDARRYFEDLLAGLTEYYYSYPLAQERIGYVGMADARGWNRIGLNEREAWEPEEQLAVESRQSAEGTEKAASSRQSTVGSRQLQTRDIPPIIDHRPPTTNNHSSLITHHSATKSMPW